MAALSSDALAGAAAFPRKVEAQPDGAPLTWVLHDGKAGMRSQVLGLAEAVGFPLVERPLAIRLPWRWLPPQLWLRSLAAPETRLAPPWPDLVIACGRNAARPAATIRRMSGGRTVAAQIQDPKIGRNAFDLFIAPAHDRLRGPRVIHTLGAVHRVTPTRLAAERDRFPSLARLPRPILSVLIGGNNSTYRLTLDRLGEIAEAIGQAVRTSGGAALVTPSRRTGEAGIALLRERLAGLPGEVWDGSSDNPYFAYLALADALCVTADSVSMVSEAAATGKPVHILDLPGGNRKFARFHRAMREAGITRPFTGGIESWSYPIPDDTACAGAAVRQLVLDRRTARGR